MSSGTGDLVRAAVEIARTVGLVAAERFAAGTTASLKPDGTEVTPADVEVERLIRALIAERFPDDRTYGEEEGEAGGGSGRRWVIDPTGPRCSSAGFPHSTGCSRSRWTIGRW